MNAIRKMATILDKNSFEVDAVNAFGMKSNQKKRIQAIKYAIGGFEQLTIITRFHHGN